MKKEKIVIMYDSPEAAKLVDMKVWVSTDPETGRTFMHQDEGSARWSGCTHRVCTECGKPTKKHSLVCQDCIDERQINAYKALPYKEWDKKEFVCTAYDDRYFWSLSDLEEFMYEQEEDEIDLLICDPIHYCHVDLEDVSQETHEDWEPEDELVEKIKELNKFIETLPPHSWRPGKVRTSYKLPPQE